MPEENSSDNVSQRPVSEALIQPPSKPPGNQDPPSPPSNGNSANDNEDAQNLEQDIRSGERWLIGIGILAVVINTIIALIYWGQLGQMRQSTRAATKAANAASDSVELNQGNFDRTMSQMITQTTQQVKAANAARSAADTAKETLHISERAYIVFGEPSLNATSKLVNLQFVDMGHLPSGPAEVIVHEATFNVLTPTAAPKFFEAVEKNWGRTKYSSISPSVPMDLEIPVPAVLPQKLNVGLQIIVVVGFISYNDGFPHTPLQRQMFCVQTRYQIIAERFFLTPCEDAAYYLSQMEAIDGYPNNESK